MGNRVDQLIQDNKDCGWLTKATSWTVALWRSVSCSVCQELPVL